MKTSPVMSAIGKAVLGVIGGVVILLITGMTSKLEKVSTIEAKVSANSLSISKLDRETEIYRSVKIDVEVVKAITLRIEKKLDELSKK